jgi:thiosulfate/3-mercaptopyruvate sulfurtransferase
MSFRAAKLARNLQYNYEDFSPASRLEMTCGLLVFVLTLLLSVSSCSRISEEKTAAEQETVASLANPSAIIEPLELWQAIQGGHNKVIIEVSKPDQFAEGHLPGAVNCYRPDFAAEKGTYHYGGMRAEAAKLESLFQQLGINTGDELVIYDKKGNCDAARLWWLLHLHNYDKVQLLNGGQLAWIQDSLPISTEI